MNKLFLTIILLSFCPQVFSFAEGTYQVIIQKQAEKMNTRFSLSDYMRMQKQFALMDQWLALHSSPDYPEFAIWGARNNITDVNQTMTKIGNEYGALFYYKIFGIEGKIEEVSPLVHDKSLMLGLRLFGRADQGTHLKILYGVEKVEDYQLNDTANPQVGGVAATLYLLPFLGIDGGYHHYWQSTFKSSQTELTGESFEYGAFIEVFLLRFYFTQMNKKLYYKNTTTLVQSQKTFKTNSIGIRLYF